MGTIIFDHVTEDMAQITITKLDDGSITVAVSEGGVILDADTALDMAVKVSQETA